MNLNSWLSDVRSNTSPPPGCPLHNAGRNSQPNLQQKYRSKSSSVATASIEDVDMASSGARQSAVKPFSEIPVPGKYIALVLKISVPKNNNGPGSGAFSIISKHAQRA